MIMKVNRFVSDDDSTISDVLIDGVKECYGLEDEYREEKKVGETRIPAGIYRVGVRTVGGFHNRYSKRFADIHQGMLHILNVPNFEYILIHCGNTDEHTEGCLLVGREGITTPGDMMVTHSTAAYRAFYPKVIDAALNDDLMIEFVDRDR